MHRSRDPCLPSHHRKAINAKGSLLQLAWHVRASAGGCDRRPTDHLRTTLDSLDLLAPFMMTGIFTWPCIAT